MFKAYQSKPVERQAFQILETDQIKQLPGSNTIELYRDGNQAVAFKAHEPVSVGDWVIRLTRSDTYHCTDAVFRERNIVGIPAHATITKGDMLAFIGSDNDPTDELFAVVTGDYDIGQLRKDILAYEK